MSKEISNTLSSWVAKNQKRFREAGYELRKHDARGNCIAFDIDSPVVAGTICHWPPATFEFLILSRNTGKVLFLESPMLKSLEELDAYMNTFLAHLAE